MTDVILTNDAKEKLRELSTVHRLTKESERVQNKIDELRMSYDSIGSPEITDIPKGSSNTSSVAERKAIEVADLLRYLENVELQIITELHELLDYIMAVDDIVVRSCMWCRFVDGMTWTEVAEENGYSNHSGPRNLVFRYLNKTCITSINH